MDDSHRRQQSDDQSVRAAEHIYRKWDEALARSDPEALLACYAPDAVLESPLVPHILGTETGVCRGHAELRSFFQTIAERKPTARRHYRTGFFTDGRTLMFEYPRETPDGEQMDFAEIMELRDGLIQRHRVYWGWYGVRVIQKDAYHR